MTEPPPLPRGLYDLIYADPPWPYPARNNPGTKFGLGAGGHYQMMKVRDIAALKVREMAARDALLYLWVTGPRLLDGIEVCGAGGFRYTTFGFVWVKTNPKSGTWFFGTGHHTKSNAEVCLLGIKGRAILPAVNAISSLIVAPRGANSAKPTEARRRLELMYPGYAKVELFARQRAPGWVAWGNELAPGRGEVA